jgi:hypothetical protein
LIVVCIYCLPLFFITGYSCRGCELWRRETAPEGITDNPKTWGSIVPAANFGMYMSENRFKEFRKLIFRVQENDSAKETDPWWEFTAAVDEFSKQ